MKTNNERMMDARQRSGLTRKAFAAALDLSLAAVDSYRKPTANKCARCASIRTVKLAELMWPPTG